MEREQFLIKVENAFEKKYGTRNNDYEDVKQDVLCAALEFYNTHQVTPQRCAHFCSYNISKIIANYQNKAEMLDIDSVNIAITEEAVLKAALAYEQHDKIMQVLNTLTSREQRVIKLRCGLENQDPMDLRQVGKILKVTPERVRQIEAKAIRKLRHPSIRKKLIDFLN